jgi:hypothetical protein
VCAASARRALRRAGRRGVPGGGRLLPPAYWPHGSPGRWWCRRGGDAGGQARMSGSPPPRRSKRCSHSCLTACPAPRRPATRRGRWRDAPSARAASLASSAACPPTGRCGIPGPAPGAATPTLDSTRNPTLDPTHATGVPPRRLDGGSPQVAPLRGASRPQKPRPTGPPRGSGAAAPSGALRAIDSTARPRSWRAFGPRRLRRQSHP